MNDSDFAWVVSMVGLSYVGGWAFGFLQRKIKEFFTGLIG